MAHTIQFLSRSGDGKVIEKFGGVPNHTKRTAKLSTFAMGHGLVWPYLMRQ